LAEQILTEHDQLDVLVNNAGIGTGGRAAAERELSEDGHELRFAIMYLAPFLLTRLLEPLLVRSAPARIVNVASAGQAAIDFDDVMLERDYSGVQAYCQSKLALVMLTFDLADELRGVGVTANCLHPGTYLYADQDGFRSGCQPRRLARVGSRGDAAPDCRPISGRRDAACVPGLPVRRRAGFE
jgi:NAD(P)-dependent dehydrogenase (short-subunit alcohol dehydrogenase family)